MLFERSKKWLLILLGTLIWSLTMVKSGLVYHYGMGFWGPNGHDGIWHISLINSLSRGSLNMPIFTGENIQNYHIGFDLILAVIHVSTRIPAINLYFQIIPPILAFSIGFLTYKFVLNWTKSEKSALLSTFFVYFGGSFSWVLGKGESTFWSQQSISTLINPPFAASLALLLAGLICIQNKKTLPAIIIFILLPQIKIYAGLLALVGLLVASFKDNYLWKIFIPSSIASLLLFIPLNTQSSNLIVFRPLWFLDTLMGPDRLNWPRFFSALNTYKSGHIWFKAIPAYIVVFAIFWIGNMGTRIFKEILIFKWLKNISEISFLELFVSTVIIVGGIIPMLFVQSGTTWNTIQFFYYSLFFSSILAGIAITKLNKLLIFIIILLTIPTTFDTLKHYLPSRPPAMVSKSELQALTFLSKQSSGVVLTYPFDKQAADAAISNPPRPLYLYESTAYVSALSSQPVFMEDEVNLNITGYDWQSRRQQMIEFINTSDASQASNFLAQNHIKYLYLASPKFRPQVSQIELNMSTIFDNSEVAIWMVK